MEEEIGREPAAGRGIDSPHPVPKDERRHRRPAVLVADVEHDATAGFASEKNVDVTSETQVLRSLTDVEADLRLALARIAAVNLHDPVFEAQPRKSTLERTILIHDHVGPALDDLGSGRSKSFGSGLPGRPPVERSGVGAVGGQLGRDARLVVDLDQEDRPSVLDQASRGRPLRGLDPALGVDLDPDQAMVVQDALNRSDRGFGPGRIDRLLDAGFLVAGKRLAEHFERLDHPLHLRREGLKLDVEDNRKTLGPARGVDSGPNGNNPRDLPNPGPSQCRSHDRVPWESVRQSALQRAC